MCKASYPNFESVTRGFEAKAQACGGNDYWLAKAKRAQNKSPLESLENIIRAMPLDQKQKLKRKFDNIIPAGTKGWNEQYDEARRKD